MKHLGYLNLWQLITSDHLILLNSHQILYVVDLVCVHMCVCCVVKGGKGRQTHWFFVIENNVVFLVYIQNKDSIFLIFVFLSCGGGMSWKSGAFCHGAFHFFSLSSDKFKSLLSFCSSHATTPVLSCIAWLTPLFRWSHF